MQQKCSREKTPSRALAAYDAKKVGETEIPFTPGRVVLQDFTGVPAMVEVGENIEAAPIQHLFNLAECHPDVALRPVTVLKLLPIADQQFPAIAESL